MKSLSQTVSEASFSDLMIKNLENKDLLTLLQSALAEEYLQWYQYTVVIPFAVGHDRVNIVEAFKEHAKDELEDHAAWLIERINQLDGVPTLVDEPSKWNLCAVHKYITPKPPYDVCTLLEQNIQSEKGAIETYTALEAVTRHNDIVTNKKVKEILADEQEHLQNLIDLHKDICGHPICDTPDNAPTAGYDGEFGDNSENFDF